MLPFYEELKPINVLFSTNRVKSFCLVYIALNIYVTFENHIYKFKSSCFREMLHFRILSSCMGTYQKLIKRVKNLGLRFLQFCHCVQMPPFITNRPKEPRNPTDVLVRAPSRSRNCLFIPDIFVIFLK